MKKSKRVLVLLIGEVLEDPRVLKTCLSLRDMGLDVSVACSNPSNRPAEEVTHDLTIQRFRHPGESAVKRLYAWLQGRLKPEAARAVSRLHEQASGSTLKNAFRNMLLGMNFRHLSACWRNWEYELADSLVDSVFDLVHCNDVDTLHAGVSLKKQGRAHVLLYDSHEFWPGTGVQGSPVNDALRKIEAAHIACADYVVTVNHHIARLIQKEYGLATLPSVVMNCPVLKEEEIVGYHVNDPVRILYQGKLQAFRGLEELLLAMKDVDGAHLTFSGYGPREEYLRQLADAEGLADRVHFEGRFMPDDSAAIIRRHDIGVIPYLPVTLNNSYASPNKLFEYAMGGLAVAAGDLPFLREVITENDMGSLFDSSLSSSISNALNGLIHDRDLLRRCRENARKAAVDTYYWQAQFEANYPWRP